MRQSVLLLIILLVSGPLSVQATDTRWHFKSFFSHRGIDLESVTHLTESVDGSVWLAIPGKGVYGIHETRGRLISEEDGLAGNDVEVLEPDEDGGLWVGSRQGLSFIREGKVTRFDADTLFGVSALHWKNNGSLWVGSLNGYVQALSIGPSGEAIWDPIIGPELTGGVPVRQILQDPSGMTWVNLEGNHALHFDGTDWLQILDENEEKPVYSQFLRDSSGTVWAVAKGGVLRFDENTWVRGTHLNPWTYHTQSIPEPISCIAELTTGELLVGTAGGLRMKKEGQWTDLRFDEAIGQPDILSIWESSDHSLWIRTPEGVIHGERKSWRRFISSDQGTLLKEETLTLSLDHAPLCADDQGGLATYGNDRWVIDYDFAHPVISMTRPENQRVWIASDDQAIEFSLHENAVIQSIPISEVSPPIEIIRFHEGILILGGPGVFQLEGYRFIGHPRYGEIPKETNLKVAEGIDEDTYIVQGNRVEHIIGQSTVNLSDQYPELAEYVYTSIHCASDGTVWLGTLGDGVLYLNEEGVHRFTDQEGLISNHISEVFQTSDGAIWVAYSLRGVASYRDGRWINFTHDHGMPNTSVERIGEGLSGQLWLSAKSSGVYQYFPDRSPPETFIQEAPEEIGYHGVGILKFTGIDAWNSTHPDHLEFSWRFIPLESDVVESDWSPFSSERTVLTPSLSPGSYRFEVRAADLHRNLDPTPESHSFRVAFPLWRKPEFYLPMGAVGTVALLALLGFLRSHTALREYRDELEERVEDRTASLESRRRELETALSEIKTLRGIIPICASCKKIRDDEGFWSQVEVYVSDHTEADFTHGLCPDCFDREIQDLER